MKILIVHNQYQLRSGEETVVDNEIRALQNRGHTIVTYFVCNSEINSLWAKITAGLSVIYSFKHKWKISALIQREQPDIVHVHNVFPLISPSVFDACAESKTTCIHTLHNYRVLCPSTTLFHRGEIYTKGLNGNYLRVWLDRVYRDSLVGTGLLIVSILFHRFRRTWLKVNRIVVMSEFQREIVEQKISTQTAVVPHFSPQGTPTEILKTNDEYHCFTGRLDTEKGILRLLDIWPDSENLVIIGDGPLAAQIESICADRPNITLLGTLSRDEVLATMQLAHSVVVSSICHETFGLVVIESFSVGTPVLVNDLPPVSDLVEEHRTGYKFDILQPKTLYKSMKMLKENALSIRQNCLDEYTQNYSEAVGGENLEQLMFNVLNKT